MFLKILCFFWFRPPSWDKWTQKLDKISKKKIKIWWRAVFVKNRIFQNYFQRSVPILNNCNLCKFQQDHIIFGGIRVPKPPPKVAQFMDAPLPQNFLKIFNLRTTNAMKMKLGTIVYLHETFRLTKDLDVAQRGSKGMTGKALKN